MTETQIEFLSAGLTLRGTCCLPDGPGPFPVVLMIHGSGPLDRDENMPGQRLDVFNAIAAAFARVGIASIRYDKRGCGASGGSYYSAGYEDFVADAAALVGAVGGFHWCAPRQIYLLGHSEGCLVAPEVSRRVEIAGLVLLCPVYTDIETLLRRQAERIRIDAAASGGPLGWFYRLFALSRADHERLVAKLKASSTDTIRFRFRRLEAKALRQLLALDVKALVNSVSCPMLVIGGGKDIQCDPADVERIAKATNAVVEAHVLPDLTHVLRSDSLPPSLFRYGELLKRPIDPRLLELMTSWIQS